MSTSSLFENPSETTFITAILGIFTSQGLSVSELTILGRIIIYFGEALITIAVLQAALEAEESAKKLQTNATNNHQLVSGEKEEAFTPPDDIHTLVKQLQQQNQRMQEQICALQEKVSIIQTK